MCVWVDFTVFGVILNWAQKVALMGTEVHSGRCWEVASLTPDLQAVSLLVLDDCSLTGKSNQDKWRTHLVNNVYGVILFLAEWKNFFKYIFWDFIWAKLDVHQLKPNQKLLGALNKQAIRGTSIEKRWKQSKKIIDWLQPKASLGACDWLSFSFNIVTWGTDRLGLWFAYVDLHSFRVTSVYWSHLINLTRENNMMSRTCFKNIREGRGD